MGMLPAKRLDWTSPMAGGKRSVATADLSAAVRHEG